MAELFIRERDGDNNFEGSTDESLVEVVDRVLKNKGYFTTDDECGDSVFVPYHRIDFIRLGDK